MNSGNVSFSLISWNVRGLGDTNKRSLVRDAISSSRPNFICLQETKLDNIDCLTVKSFLPAYLDAFQHLNAAGTRGGILTAWDSSAFTLSSSFSGPHSLTTLLTSSASDYSFSITNAYAPSNHHDSLAFLDSLEDTA
ncbi:hypothetical protein SETIT_7G319000v2, partial [Setaria italica]